MNLYNFFFVAKIQFNLLTFTTIVKLVLKVQYVKPLIYLFILNSTYQKIRSIK
jgi:hypothetical protein